MPQRSNTTKGSVGSIRYKISGPVELIHTTNMLSYNAPDIFPKTVSPTASASSARSDDSLSEGALTAASSPPTSPDVPTQRCASPEPNRLSTYFTASPQAAVPATKSEAPAIPQRAPSHTKRGTYESLNRHRSASRLSEQSSRTVSTKASLTFSRSSSASTSTSATSRASSTHHKASSPSATPQSPAPSTPASPPVQFHHRREYSETHPFGQELAQVTEIAEEYGLKGRLNVIDEEEQELAAKGLFKFSAEEYMSEIRDILSTFFGEPRPAAAMWI